MKNITASKQRSSNFELLRILAMMGIMASHYNGYIAEDLKATFTPLSEFLLIQANWGKIGIDIFMLISGYFMCTKDLSWQRYIKLWIQIYFYQIIIGIPLVLFGALPSSANSFINLIFPWRIINMDNFITAFMIFYLLTPFVRLLIINISKRQLGILIVMFTFIYVGYNSIPRFQVYNDPIIWFSYLYFVAGYIRLYGFPIKDSSLVFWGTLLIVNVLLVCVITVLMHRLGLPIHRLTGEANSLFAVPTSISSFMFFKNLKMHYSKLVNMLGAATFGVLLIHTNSIVMTKIVFVDLFDTPALLEKSFFDGIAYFSGTLIILYISCSVIDIIRKLYIESRVLDVVYRFSRVIGNHLKK